MALRVHHLLDTFAGVSKDYRPLIADGMQDHTVDYIMERIRAAEKFDFGQLDLGVDEAGVSYLPQPTEDEWQFWSDGLIPLPANPSWYEFETHADGKFSWMGLLVTTTRRFQM